MWFCLTNGQASGLPMEVFYLAARFRSHISRCRASFLGAKLPGAPSESPFADSPATDGDFRSSLRCRSAHGVGARHIGPAVDLDDVRTRAEHGGIGDRERDHAFRVCNERERSAAESVFEISRAQP